MTSFPNQGAASNSAGIADHYCVFRVFVIVRSVVPWGAGDHEWLQGISRISNSLSNNSTST